MKRIAVMLMLGISLGACDRIPHKIGESVRHVQVAESIVSDGWNEVVYRTESDLNRLDFSESEPTLYVNLIDVETGNVFKVDMGSECNQWPVPRGHQFLARFDRSASKAKPNDIYIAPQTYPVRKFLCG
jgi:hypothetical protein